jgi:hypothetical protein
MKKKKVKALIRKLREPGPVGAQGVAGKDMSKEVGELAERVRRLEEVLGKGLVKKFIKGQDSGKQ